MSWKLNSEILHTNVSGVLSKASKRLSPLGAVGIALGLVGAFAGHSASAQDVAITGVTVATGDGSEPADHNGKQFRAGHVGDKWPNNQRRFGLTDENVGRCRWRQ